MKISSIKETCIYVDDLSKAKTFYHDVLKLDLISFVPERHLFFKVGDNMLLCFDPETTKKEVHLPPHFAYGNQHIAFEVLKEEYYDWKEKLQFCQIGIIYEHHWRKDLYSFYFKDPAGNILEIVMPGIWD